MQNRLTTTTCPIPQRLEYWRDIVSQHFVKLSCELDPIRSASTSRGLEASLDQMQMGALDLLEVKAQAQTVTRHTRHKPREDYFLFTLQLQGDCEVIQDDRKVIIQPGEMVLYDTRRPYRVALRDDFHMCTVRIPVDMLRLHLPNAEQFVARKVSSDGYAANVLGSLLRSLFQAPDTLQAQDQAALSRSLMDVLATGLRSVSPQCCEVQHSRLGQFHLDRIKHTIECQLGDPLLGVEQLASLLKMSSSSIHRAFESAPYTVSEYIWNRRLEACKTALLTPALAHHSIGDIAYSWGFTSNAHFSRVFKKHTGMTPRDYRSR